jgi:hypothetical protein
MSVKVISGLVIFTIQARDEAASAPGATLDISCRQKLRHIRLEIRCGKRMLSNSSIPAGSGKAQIAWDESLRTSFVAVLTVLVSRGSHAAIALNSGVAGSIGG